MEDNNILAAVPTSRRPRASIFDNEKIVDFVTRCRICIRFPVGDNSREPNPGRTREKRESLWFQTVDESIISNICVQYKAQNLIRYLP